MEKSLFLTDLFCIQLLQKDRAKRLGAQEGDFVSITTLFFSLFFVFFLFVCFVF